MGNMGSFLRLKKDVQFVAVCDVDALHLAKAKERVDRAQNNSDCRTYGDFREFLEKEKLDAVSLALPDHWHGIITFSGEPPGPVPPHLILSPPLARTSRNGSAS
jgi:predicted dehydrogenase